MLNNEKLIVTLLTINSDKKMDNLRCLENQSCYLMFMAFVFSVLTLNCLITKEARMNSRHYGHIIMVPSV